MRPLVFDLIVAGLMALALVVAWNSWAWQQKATDIGFRFDQRHPTMSTLLVSIGAAAAGVLASWRVIDLLTNHFSVAVLAAAVVGAIFGAGGFIIWAYAYAHGFRVAGWIGRVLLGLTLLLFAAAAGAVFGGYLPDSADALSVSIVATRLLPWSVGLLVQARDDMRHPGERNDKVMRAMILSTGHRPPATKGNDAEHI